MMSLWDALRMNMMISYQELVRTFLSYELVKSWETKRRHPTGAARKLLLLLQGNPLIINLLKVV
ncbi:transcriptional regulator [Klebsiella pneumoniae]|uniref:Transcriptional regulator n=1 Tax=Klebsiella pneumoniae TaxID=573 RepID=A0A8B4UEG4_KLEPN|nr:transcriptional regulator [Klebsiella pneumoniae]